jgi:hypothetical protein
MTFGRRIRRRYKQARKYYLEHFGPARFLPEVDDLKLRPRYTWTIADDETQIQNFQPKYPESPGNWRLVAAAIQHRTVIYWWESD